MSVERTLLAGVASVLTAAGAVGKLPDGPRTLLRSLGWDLPPGVDDIGLASLDIGDVLGLFELRREPADPSRFQVAHLRHIVHWDRMETMVTEPSDLLRDVY